MNELSGTEHAWFRRQLPDRLLDLLDERDLARFEAHARGCETCAELLLAARHAHADWWDGAGHPSVEALMNWTPGAGGPGSHDVVREHLSHCESCRGDLAELRGPGILDAIAVVGTVVPLPLPPPLPIRRVSWVPRFAGAVGLAAALAAVWFVNRPASLGTSPASSAHGTQPPAAAPPQSPGAVERAPAPKARPVVQGEPIDIVAPERGVPATSTPVAIAPGVTVVRLTLPALPVSESASLRLELLGPDGSVVWAHALAAGLALRRGGVMVPAERFVTGPHVLRVTWKDPAQGDSARQYALDVRTSQ